MRTMAFISDEKILQIIFKFHVSFCSRLSKVDILPIFCTIAMKSGHNGIRGVVPQFMYVYRVRVKVHSERLLNFWQRDVHTVYWFTLSAHAFT